MKTILSDSNGRSLVLYEANFIPNPGKCFEDLMKLPWVHMDTTPRRECFISLGEEPLSYTYGSGGFSRTYESTPLNNLNADDGSMESMILLWAMSSAKTDSIFELCFLNHYRDGRDHLGFHSDDSPEIDQDRPIVIITLGAEREIWFAEKEGFSPKIDTPTKLKLGNGSICIMAGRDIGIEGTSFQETHMHRIPKSGDSKCGPRISLTFRGKK